MDWLVMIALNIATVTVWSAFVWLMLPNFVVALAEGPPARKVTMAAIALVAGVAFYIAFDAGFDWLAVPRSPEYEPLWRLSPALKVITSSMLAITVYTVVYCLWPPHDSDIDDIVGDIEPVAPVGRPASITNSLTVVDAPALGNTQRRQDRSIATAMERAIAVRTPIGAVVNGIATRAQVTALAHAQWLAEAAARTAAAEAKGIDALIQRADRLSEMHIRRELEHKVRADRIEELDAQLIENEHKRTLAAERRNKERLQAAREALEARHSLEATKLFKKEKFELGRARLQGRQNDAEVDSKTAEAVVVKIASELNKLGQSSNPDIASWIKERIALVEASIEDGEADGQITAAMRAELTVLQKLKTTV